MKTLLEACYFVSCMGSQLADLGVQHCDRHILLGCLFVELAIDRQLTKKSDPRSWKDFCRDWQPLVR